jgi:hypothetical protein
MSAATVLSVKGKSVNSLVDAAIGVTRNAPLWSISPGRREALRSARAVVSCHGVLMDQFRNAFLPFADLTTRVVVEQYSRRGIPVDVIPLPLCWSFERVQIQANGLVIVTIHPDYSYTVEEFRHQVIERVLPQLPPEVRPVDLNPTSRTGGVPRIELSMRRRVVRPQDIVLFKAAAVRFFKTYQ